MYKNFISYSHEAQHVSGDTAHHQEPKTALAVSGFAYVEGCWTLTASSNYTSNNPTRMQNQRLLVQFQAPDDGRCRPKHVEFHINMKEKIFIHSCILLAFLCELYYDARIHEHQVVYVRFYLQ